MRTKLLTQTLSFINKTENKKNIGNLTDLLIALLNSMYIIRGGKKLIINLLENALLAKFEQIWLNETDPKLRQKILKFFITLIDNCFLKSPKELSFEEVESNFGFYFLFNSAEGGSEEKKENKGEEKLLSNLLRKESKTAAESEKFFSNKDISNIKTSISNIIQSMSKLLDAKVSGPVKFIEKSQIILFISKIVRIGNEELDEVVIKNNLLQKAIDLARTLNNNSLIHGSVVDLLRGVLQQQGFPIRNNLLYDCNVIAKFIEYVQNDRIKTEYFLV